MLATFLVGVVIAVNLTRSDHTARSTPWSPPPGRWHAGTWGTRSSFRDRTEFGELAGHFNTMSSALRDGYAKLEQEIVERKQAQSALVESEGFLNTIFDSIRDPFCIIDRSYPHRAGQRRLCRR